MHAQMIAAAGELSPRLEIAYTELAAAIQQEYVAQTEYDVAVLDLKNARQAIVFQHSGDPKVMGANEAARNAYLDECTKTHSDTACNKEGTLRYARHMTELARLKVESARAQLRLAEAVFRALGGDEEVAVR